MKIVLFAQGLINRAGIERMTVELSNLLSDKENQVTIILIEPYKIDLAPYLIFKSVNIISLNSTFSGISLNISNIFKLRKHLKQISPDVLITVATPLTRISIPAVTGMKVKHIAWEHFNLFAGSKLGSIWKIISTYFVDKTVVLTEEDAKNYCDSKARNIVSISNFSTIYTNPPSKLSTKVLLAVGRHSHQKGFDLLLDAWSKSEVGDWKLKIVGSGALMQDNIQKAQELGIKDSVIFVDNTANIVEEYQNASCFILSSRYEGLVMVLIEAKMMGLPCISFDCPTGPKEIIRDKIDGFLVKNGDIDALASTISQVITDNNLLAYGERARLDAINRYGAQMAFDKWNSIIKS